MKRTLPVLLLTSLIFALKTSTGLAASYSLSPATGTYTLNSTYNADVKFDTGADSVKTVRAYLTFPANLLSIDDVFTSGSAIVTWSERLYSNNNGTISLSGDVLSTGITGADKLLATIKFRAKGNGTASVKFVSTSAILRASDNADVLSLTSSTNGSYNLGVTAAQPTASPSATVPETGAPLPTQAVIVVSLFLIILGIWLGRSTYQNP